MTILHEFPSLLVAALVLLLGAGLITLTWGRKLPRQGDWVIWSGLLVTFAAFAARAVMHSEDGFKPFLLSRQWVGGSGEEGAIAVGLLEDPLGFAMSGLVLLIVALVLSNRQLHHKEPRPDRTYASLAFAAAGSVLSWISLTPWLAFIGLILTALGGFVALGSRWDENDEASLATSFATQTSCGVLLAVLGACGLAVTRTGLGWGEAGGWSASSQSPVTDAVAGSLLLAGLFIQGHPFPFLGRVLTPSRTPTLMRVLTAQILPACAAFAILLRSSPELERMGMMVPFGWVQLASAALVVGAGVFQRQWRMGIGAWLSASFSIAMAALAFAGPSSALALLIGTVLGGTTIAYAGSCLSAGGSQSATQKSRGLWSRLIGFLGMGVATGLLLFVPAGGAIQWIVRTWEQPLVAAIYVLGLFACFALGWKLTWQLFQVKKPVQLPWAAVLAPLLLILPGLAVVWTGSITGGALPGDPDRIFPSALALFFNGAEGGGVADDSAHLAVSGAYWAGLLLAMFLGYWMAQKAEGASRKNQVDPRSPLVQFVAEGYGVDRLAGRALTALALLG
ncbi:MAG: hypothetical protein NDJ90_02405, partial [Oligoflexia bacterium]|nr:hypothetical protein [Oligoflexia bacterium]